MELRRHKPSPISFRTLAGQIIPLVTALGEKDAADFYEALYDKYQDDIQKGVSPCQVRGEVPSHLERYPHLAPSSGHQLFRRKGGKLRLGALHQPELGEQDQDRPARPFTPLPYPG